MVYCVPFDEYRMTTSQEAGPASREPQGLWAPILRLWRRSRFANRRRFRRYNVHTTVEVTFGDRSHDCEIVNISSGGALLMPILDCSTGTMVRVATRALPAPLIGKVVSRSNEGTGIQFDSTLSGSFATLWLNSVNSVLRAEPKR